MQRNCSSETLNWLQLLYKNDGFLVILWLHKFPLLTICSVFPELKQIILCKYVFTTTLSSISLFPSSRGIFFISMNYYATISCRIFELLVAFVFPLNWSQYESSKVLWVLLNISRVTSSQKQIPKQIFYKTVPISTITSLVIRASLKILASLDH